MVVWWLFGCALFLALWCVEGLWVVAGVFSLMIVLASCSYASFPPTNSPQAPYNYLMNEIKPRTIQRKCRTNPKMIDSPCTLLLHGNGWNAAAKQCVVYCNLTHSFIHSFILSSFLSLIFFHILSFIHGFMVSFIHGFIDSLVHWLVGSGFINSLIVWFADYWTLISFFRSVIGSLLCFFVDSFHWFIVFLFLLHWFLFPWFIRWLIWFIDSLLRSFIRSPIHWFIGSSVHLKRLTIFFLKSLPIFTLPPRRVTGIIWYTPSPVH